ncbi:MAG: HesA/MoeB/ThiF family protein [Synergistes sp.]|nr:HesA/MoeB/ThiF family protein [Synergistes sp.]
MKNFCESQCADFMRCKAKEHNGISIVSLAVTSEAAEKFSISHRDAQIIALQNGLCPSRYEKSIGTIGLCGQAKLLKSCAAVAGCGGLGGWIIEILARAGVGRLILIDGDTFCESNLNRQLYSSENKMGVSKAAAAAERVCAVNSAVRTEVCNTFINLSNGCDLLSQADIVVDALDSAKSRLEVFDVCKKLNIPFVHGAVAGFFGELAVLMPHNRPLWDAQSCAEKGLEDDLGCPSFIVPFVASMQASETIKILAGLSAQKDELLWFDTEQRRAERIKLNKKEIKK